MHKRKVCRLYWILALVFAVATQAQDQENQGLVKANRTPPPEYLEKVAPLLTPFDKVPPPSKRYRDHDLGTIQLAEFVYYVRKNGLRYYVARYIIHPQTEAGAKALDESRFSFRKSQQRIYLVKADTILADGTRVPVRENAAFIHDRADGEGVYEDGGELAVSYTHLTLPTRS